MVTPYCRASAVTRLLCAFSTGSHGQQAALDTQGLGVRRPATVNDAHAHSMTLGTDNDAPHTTDPQPMYQPSTPVREHQIVTGPAAREFESGFEFHE